MVNLLGNWAICFDAGCRLRAICYRLDSSCPWNFLKQCAARRRHAGLHLRMLQTFLQCGKTARVAHVSQKLSHPGWFRHLFITYCLRGCIANTLDNFALGCLVATVQIKVVQTAPWLLWSWRLSLSIVCVQLPANIIFTVWRSGSSGAVHLRHLIPSQRIGASAYFWEWNRGQVLVIFFLSQKWPQRRSKWTEV